MKKGYRYIDEIGTWWYFNTKANKKYRLYERKCPSCGRIEVVWKKYKDSSCKKCYLSTLCGESHPMWGRTHTEETKKLQSKLKKGKAHPMFGRDFSESHRKALSKANSGKNNAMWGMFKEKNPNWRGGTSYEPYCEIWTDVEYKDSVKERDGYKCMNPSCSNISTKLVLHHIDYDKKNCHPWNLITICNSCNGKANKYRTTWENFYKNILYYTYDIGGFIV